MAKFKPARTKARASRIPQGGIPCVILLISGIVLLMLFMYFVLKSSATS